MKIKTDILIIGGGVSGLTLAIKLSELIPDGEILLITKENIEECNTFYAQGGIASVHDENDDFKKHIKDTLIAGDGLCDEKVVEFIIGKAPEMINDLILTALKRYDMKLRGKYGKREKKLQKEQEQIDLRHAKSHR